MKFLSTALAFMVATSNFVDSTVEAAQYKVVISSGLGTRSHVKPLFELGLKLESKNCSVKYVAPYFNQHFLKGYPFEFVELSSADIQENPMKIMSELISSGKKLDNEAMMKTFRKLVIPEYQVNFKRFYDFLVVDKPDLVICDFITSFCIDAARKLKIPTVAGFQTIDMGTVFKDGLLSESMDYGPLYLNELTFYQRFHQTVVVPIKGMYNVLPALLELNRIKKSYGVKPNFSPFTNFNDVLCIANTFFGFELARNLPPNVKLIGPILSENLPQLSDGLKSFLDTKQKVVYIAFGSAVVLNKNDVNLLFTALLNALQSKVIDGIVWGLSTTPIENFPDTFSLDGKVYSRQNLVDNSLDSIRVSKWAPQPTLLKHPNLKLFITHGGLESIFEAIDASTPMLTVPVMGDQPRNAKKLEMMGIAKYIDKFNTDPNMVYDTIKSIVEDKDNNIKLNLNKFKLIVDANKSMKDSVIELILNYIKLHKLCNSNNAEKDVNNCEIDYLIPRSNTTKWVAFINWDIYLIIGLTVLSVMASILYAAFKLIRFISFKLDKSESSKLKSN